MRDAKIWNDRRMNGASWIIEETWNRYICMCRIASKLANVCLLCERKFSISIKFSLCYVKKYILQFYTKNIVWCLHDENFINEIWHLTIWGKLIYFIYPVLFCWHVRNWGFPSNRFHERWIRCIAKVLLFNFSFHNKNFYEVLRKKTFLFLFFIRYIFNMFETCWDKK